MDANVLVPVISSDSLPGSGNMFDFAGTKMSKSISMTKIMIHFIY